MPGDEEVARAIAFFESCDDGALLRDVLREIQPRAAAAVRRLQRQRRSVPPPAAIAPAAQPADRDEALATLRGTDDFARLQAIARAAGRRVEELEGERG